MYPNLTKLQLYFLHPKCIKHICTFTLYCIMFDRFIHSHLNMHCHAFLPFWYSILQNHTSVNTYLNLCLSDRSKCDAERTHTAFTMPACLLWVLGSLPAGPVVLTSPSTHTHHNNASGQYASRLCQHISRTDLLAFCGPCLKCPIPLCDNENKMCHIWQDILIFLQYSLPDQILLPQCYGVLSDLQGVAVQLLG